MFTTNPPSSIFNLLILMTVLAPSCVHTSGHPEEAQEVVTPVTVTSVMFKQVSSTVDLPAVTAFLNKSIIRATVTGTIEKISIVQGDYVSSDQLLFTIKTREASALGNTTGRDSNLSFKGLINITSPKDGVINSVSYQKGDYVQEGDELASVSEQSGFVFLLDIPFELDRLVEKNRKCTIVMPDNRHFTGTITGKLSEMNIETQTIRYVVRPAFSGRLPANLIAKVILVRSTNDNAMVLPKKAILGDETQTEFWVMKLVNDSVAIKVPVTKGFENNDEVEITGPVFLSSDRIILSGNYGLPDTALISVIKE
jgi:hypothetical protein